MTPAPAGRSALVIDDEPGVRFLARVVLEADRFAVAEAEDAAAARDHVRAAVRPFDLILLDVSLPDATGADLLPELRRLSPGSRVLVISGMPEDEAGVVAD